MQVDPQQKLQQLRQEVNEIDQQIQNLINQRAQCALQIGEMKRQTEKNPVYYRPEREAQVLQVIKDRNKGPMPAQDVAFIFRTIMAAGLALQQPTRIAFLGPQGTFTEAATIKQFGYAANRISEQSIERVFQAVVAERAHFGVVPIENSTEGIINLTLDCFLQSPLKICGELTLPIHHHLLCQEANPNEITQIYGHAQALAQCRQWLQTHYPDVKLIALASNGEAANRVVSEKNSAAIAGDLAAEYYHLHKIAAHIEDYSYNTTRFWVIGPRDVDPSGCDKTSLLFASPNKPGALLQLLQPFNQHHIELTSIESRPSRNGLWEYYFFIDVLGHQQDQNLQQALTELASQALFLKVLGSYPRGSI